MLTLGLDTTGAYCTAALLNGAVCLSQTSEHMGRGHAERLAPMVQDMLSEANVAPRRIERIAVCTGPGSFTGLRVALAFAKGFALPFKIPVIGLSALEIMAAEADPEKVLSVAAVMDVRRGQLCWAHYVRGEEITPPVTQDRETAIKIIRGLGADKVVGDGSDIAGTPGTITHVSGAVLAAAAQSRRPADYPATALYSRAPDAKLPGGLTPPAMTLP